MNPAVRICRPPDALLLKFADRPAQKSTLWGRIRSDPLDGQQPHISQESADSFINPKSIKPSSTGSDKCREPWVHLSRHLFPPRRTEPKGPKPEFSGDSMKGFDGDVPLSRRKSWRQRYSEGWRAGMTVSCITALLVLILNTVVIIWASSRYPSVDGIGVIFGGECARAKRLNTWLQLVVNVLSSILLAASNYCMQCLGSPTRAEVDTAHAKGKMLDIGIPSIQNLGVIGRERGVLWAALAISALPLHFVYNSVLFLTTQANMYSIVPVNQAFPTTGFYNTSLLNGKIGAPFKLDVVNSANLIMARNRSAGVPYLERLSTFECLKEYNTQYLSSRGDVLVVQAEVVSPLLVFNESWSHIDSTGHYLGEGTAADVDVSNSFRAGIPERLISIYKVLPSQSQPSDYPSHKWQCNPVESDQTCVPPEVSPQVPWSPFGSPVHYCLSENVPERCQLNWSLQFAIIVVVSNLAKVVCMFLTLWRHDIPALITIGDAIQSFLDRPDPYTRGCCVYSDHLIQLLMQWEADVPVVMPFSSSATVLNHTRDKFLKDPKSRQWRPPRRRWWSAVPIFRWVLCIFLYIILLIVAILSYFSALHGRPATWSALRDYGIGDAVGNNIMSMRKSMPITVIVANTPQVILSYVYIVFNSLYTCMVAGHEWTQFANHRKTLRVTSPVGAQRSTFWLQLPYRYSLPLVVLSSLLAWLASQSLFLVKIDVLDHNDTDGTRIVQPEKSILSCGFSPGAIVLAIIVGTLIMLGAVLLGLRNYASEMPIASTGSAAISAACHASEDDRDAAVLPLKWGVVSKKDGVGHCCFSSKLVAPPIPGHMYM